MQYQDERDLPLVSKHIALFSMALCHICTSTPTWLQVMNLIDNELSEPYSIFTYR